LLSPPVAIAIALVVLLMAGAISVACLPNVAPRQSSRVAKLAPRRRPNPRLLQGPLQAGSDAARTPRGVGARRHPGDGVRD
jgi:hypothetical protein